MCGPADNPFSTLNYWGKCQWNYDAR
jgi:hypothetical protein